jgi:hypothetical protein
LGAHESARCRWRQVRRQLCQRQIRSTSALRCFIPSPITTRQGVHFYTMARASRRFVVIGRATSLASIAERASARQARRSRRLQSELRPGRLVARTDWQSELRLGGPSNGWRAIARVAHRRAPRGGGPRRSERATVRKPAVNELRLASRRRLPTVALRPKVVLTGLNELWWASRPHRLCGPQIERQTRVTARAETIALPSLKWLLIPFAGVAVAATIVRTIRRRARQPTVRPMSDEWLREQIAARGD